jgi:uncharacterized coiled-coil protein SlyX
MQFSEDPLDQTSSRLQDLYGTRLKQLEENICIMQEGITHLSDHVKQTQQYLMKLAHHQADIAKKLSSWPFIAVESTEKD